jgi:hypothetical protein
VNGFTAAPTCERFSVDLDYGGNTEPGWVRAGDMDLDCDPDLVAGGGYALFASDFELGNASSWGQVIP